jgi:hypothetical protein
MEAVSCTNTFVEMRQVDKGDVAYIFVIYLQPVTPEAKCSPLFILESEVGMANDVIQSNIDKVIEITSYRISRIFLASDNDPSYHDRHRAFMNFWEPIYEQWELAIVLTKLKGYRRTLPVSDMLHLGKNLQARFLKYLSTFSHGMFSKSSDRNKMLRLLCLRVLFTTLVQSEKCEMCILS